MLAEHSKARSRIKYHYLHTTKDLSHPQLCRMIFFQIRQNHVELSGKIKNID